MNEPEVRIMWRDSKSYGNGWLSLEEIQELPVKDYKTLGMLVYETDQDYYVAQSEGDIHYYNIFVIPKGAVIKKEVL